jgi:carboxyl-terminal processing protease
VGVQVLAVGDTTCGKPVGFLPTSACGQTYSVVNFESTNDRNEGRYFDGFDATCPVAEDFTAEQGGASDPLMAAGGRTGRHRPVPEPGPGHAASEAKHQPAPWRRQ